MKTNLFSMITVAVLTTVLTSCSANSSVDEAIASTSDTYNFQGIEFYVNEGDGDGVVYMDKMQPVQVYFNSTSKSLNITADLYTDLTEYSLFMGAKKGAYNYNIDDLATISVPTDVKNGQVVLGDRKWKYSFSEIEKQNFTDLETEKDYEIAANTALTIGSKVTIGKITVSYTATFVGSKTGDVIKTSGKWEGSNIVSGSHEDTISRVGE